MKCEVNCLCKTCITEDCRCNMINNYEGCQNPEGFTKCKWHTSNESNMEVYAVPNNTPIIIREDKVEEFLNIKPNEEARKKREEMLEKYKHIVTDNTKK